jgi:glycosyltransferase involved in cell wall biosynthesis
MKVLFLTVDDETRASSRTRVYQFLPYLKDHGIVHKVVAWNGKAIRPKFKGTGNILLKLYDLIMSELVNYFVMTFKIAWALLTIKTYDVVFVQKITLFRLLYLLRALKIKYVYDIDDAIYTLHSAELAKTKGNPRVKAAIEFMKSAKHMIVELPSTEEVARQNCRHVTTILGPIDVRRYHPSDISTHNAVTIGWIGSLSNTYYLFEVKEVLERLTKKYPNVEVKLIGTRGFETKEPKIKLVDWSLDTELKELGTFDIGIMPLTDDEWSRGKGSYKLLQYMALGIPSVASPVGINNKIIVEGVNGYLPKNLKDWEDKLSILIEDNSKRIEMGKRSRETAVEKYSLEASVIKYVAAIKQVYDNN